MNLCNFMVNLSLLAMPDSIDEGRNIAFRSRLIDLLIVIFRYANQLYVLHYLDMSNKGWSNNFYYHYEIATNFYKVKDKITGAETLVVVTKYDFREIDITLRRNHLNVPV